MCVGEYPRRAGWSTSQVPCHIQEGTLLVQLPFHSLRQQSSSYTMTKICHIRPKRPNLPLINRRKPPSTRLGRLHPQKAQPIQNRATRTRVNGPPPPSPLQPLPPGQYRMAPDSTINTFHREALVGRDFKFLLTYFSTLTTQRVITCCILFGGRRGFFVKQTSDHFRQTRLPRFQTPFQGSRYYLGFLTGLPNGTLVVSRLSAPSVSGHRRIQNHTTDQTVPKSTCAITSSRDRFRARDSAESSVARSVSSLRVTFRLTLLARLNHWSTANGVISHFDRRI